MNDIALFGLNPAWQRLIYLDALIHGGVSRASSIVAYASGKGINCAHIMKKYDCDPLLFQLAGGENGQKIIREIEQATIHHYTISTGAETRMCQTLIENNGSISELIDPSQPIPNNIWYELYNAAKRQIGNVQHIVFCGTFPPGMPEDFFSFLDDRQRGARIYLDGVKGVEGIILRGVHLLKVNRDELKELTGESDVDLAWKKLESGRRPEVLIVTDGSEQVYLRTDELQIVFSVPTVAVVNSIGAGDAFMGAFIAHYSRGAALEQSIVMAIGAACAKCTVAVPGLLDRQEAERLSKLVEVIDYRSI